MPFPGGLARNVQQCLKDFDIPLLLSHTVTEVLGSERVEAVKVAEVRNGKAVPNTERVFPVDTLVLSVGLLPEAELLRQIGCAYCPIPVAPLWINSFKRTYLAFLLWVMEWAFGTWLITWQFLLPLLEHALQNPR